MLITTELLHCQVSLPHYQVGIDTTAFIPFLLDAFEFVLFPVVVLEFVLIMTELLHRQEFLFHITELTSI